MDELISVIVPVYNVESLIDRCISTILKQSYKNIEIILIDDGSTDNSGKICDMYAENFPDKVVVVHQENQGQSSARNFALTIMKGKYISFVDSDDYIDEYYLEILYNNLKKDNADISVCRFKRTSLNSEKSYYSGYSQAYDKDEKIKFYLTNDMTSPCGKLFKSDLWHEISFPTGKIYEDILTIFKLFKKAKIVSVSNDFLYMYYVRTGSTTMKPFNLRTLDLLDAWNEVLSLCENHNDIIYNIANYRRNRVYFTLLCIIALYGFDRCISDFEKKTYISMLKKKFDLHWKSLVCSNLTSYNRRIVMVCFRINYYWCLKFGYFLRCLKVR